MAAPAFAAKQVVSAFGSTSGSPALGGTFASVGGTAVYNATGDVYVADSGNNRIEQFSASGSFLRVWGQDVDSSVAGTNFEICTVAANCKTGITTASTGGAMSAPQGVAVDQANGNVYVTDQGFKRVDEFSATGAFIRAFGQGVVASGPDNADAKSAKQTITIAGASGGTFTLSFRGKTTAAIPWNATATELKAALEAISTIGPGSVVVSGGPGGTTALTITFAGGLANTAVPAMAADNTELTPGGATATVTTEAGQTGFEICNTTDVCTAGTATGGGGGFGATMGYPAVAPPGAPNAGDVSVADTANLRVQEFTSSGVFVRAFGNDVVNFGTDNNSAANEVQKVTVIATSGTFTLSFGGGTTSALPYNAIPSQIEAALNALSTIGGAGGRVAVSGGPGDATGSTPYSITFGGSLAGADVAQITIVTTGLGAPVGTQLSCVAGPSTAKTLSYQWLRNGAPIGGATTANYATVAADEGRSIQCQTFAINENAGSTTVGTTSQVTSPYPGTAPPVATAAPAATVKSGTLTVAGAGGAVLGCSNGTWTGAPGFGFQWYLNGVALSGNGATTNEYTVQSADLVKAGSFQCVVTGTNVGGAAARASANLNSAPAPSPAAPAASATVTSSPTSTTSTTTPGAPAYEVCLPTNDTCKTGVAGTGVGQFGAGSPTRVALDSSGQTYAIDKGNGRLFKFNLAATSASIFSPSLVSGVPGLFGSISGVPTDVAADASNDSVYIVKPNAEGTQSTVLQFDSSANLVDTHGLGGTLTSINGLALAPSGAGNIYLSTTSAKQQVLALNTPVPPTPAFASISGATATTATFNGTVNPNGYLTGYHYEYSGDGVNWTKVSASDVSAGGGSSPEPSVQTVTGLDPNREYEARLVATKAFNPPTVSAVKFFNTLPTKPTVTTPTVSYLDHHSTAATLTATVNANNSATTYHFELGADTSYGTDLPVGGIKVFGIGVRTVSEQATGLQAGSTYHARLVAVNAQGESDSSDLVFTVPASGNPDGREYELVSPADDLHYDVRPIWEPLGAVYKPEAYGAKYVSEDGQKVAFRLGQNGTLPGMLPDGEKPDVIISTRSPEGWSWEAPWGAVTGCGGSTVSGVVLFGLSVDGVHSLLAPGCQADAETVSPRDDEGNPLTQQPSTNGSGAPSPGPLFRFDSATGSSQLITGQFNVSGPVIRSDGDHNQLWGGSPDLSTIYFSSGAPLTPDATADLGDKPLQANGYLYRWANGVTTLISKSSSGVAQDLGLPASDRPNSVSVAGDAVTFSTTVTMDAGDTNGVADVYQVRGGQTTWASKSAFTGSAQVAASRTFEGASEDGTELFFSTTEKMIGDGVATGDLDTVGDIYLYDENASAGERLTRVSVADPSCAQAPGVCNDNLSNSGATNASTAKFSTVSDDGSHVFFITGDVLNPTDTDGQQSLYVRDVVTGTTTYIAPAGAGATSATTGTDAGTVTRASLVYSESKPSKMNNFSLRPIAVNRTGTTAAFLLASNTSLPAGRGGLDSDNARDLYIWKEGGGIRRVREGTGADDNTITVPSVGCNVMQISQNAPDVSASPGCRAMTADGATIYFQTTDSLVPEDKNENAASLGSMSCYNGTERQEIVKGCDVYEVDSGTGEVHLLSSGDPGSSASYYDNSASGVDVFFLTGETLDASRDRDGGSVDIYDAKLGGGFAPPQDSECDPSLEGGCQGVGGALPQQSEIVTSGSGPENARPIHRKHRRHHKVHHRKKRHRHHGSSSRTMRDAQGGNR
jgi:hypothetical protein